MKYLLTGKEMKLLDQNTSEHFNVPTEVLMEQAAMTFVQEFLLYKEKNKINISKILVVAGLGNNGADGIAISRLLNQKGYNSSVLFLDDYLVGNTSKLYELQKDIYQKYNFPVCDNLDNIDEFDCIIDGIFGIGLSRNIGDEFLALIEKLNNTKAFKVAIDISSGVSADTGEILGIAFNADLSITFAFEKIGQILWPGNEYSGKILTAAIGITIDSALDKPLKNVTLEKSDLSLLPERKAHSNKGTYGKLLIIAGSDDMAGAAILAAKAAYRAGVGMVKIYTKECNKQILLNSIPEVLVSTYNNFNEETLISEIKWADAVVIGPGLGQSTVASKIVKSTLANVNVPMVIDADALNIISKNVDILLRPHLDIIVTPHLGEMCRLTDYPITYIQSNILDVASDFSSRYDVVTVLKDFRTITSVPYGNNYINLSGNNGMATAGSGDVLAGIIGSLLAQGATSEIAASLGVFLHGLAGDISGKKVGNYSLMASDIIEGLKYL